MWEGDESEFILINSDSDASFSDSSSVIIRRRKNILPPRNTPTLSHPHPNASIQHSNTQETNPEIKQSKEPDEFQSNNMPRPRYGSSIAALWESDSEIITKLHDGSGESHLQKPQDIIHQKNSFHVEKVSNANPSSEKRTEPFDDDETDLFER